MDIKNHVDAIVGRDNSAPKDYIDKEGFLVCGKCHTRKQCEVDFSLLMGKVKGSSLRKEACRCQCEQERIKKEAEEKERHDFLLRIDTMWQDGLTDPEFLKEGRNQWTFASDDQRKPDISKTCQKYVEKWDDMRADNIGLLFFGGVGTGKSFYAYSIANALMANNITVLVTTLPHIIRRLETTRWDEDKNEILQRLQKYELLVIDDLGVERNTGYANEQVYAIIDARYRSGKPLIVTTNLAPSEIKNPENISYERIYDRILQNCIPIKMTGVSRRKEIAAEKRTKYQAVLGLPK